MIIKNMNVVRINTTLYTDPTILSPLWTNGNSSMEKVITFPPPIKNVKKYWLKETIKAILPAEIIPGRIIGKVT